MRPSGTALRILMPTLRRPDLTNGGGSVGLVVGQVTEPEVGVGEELKKEVMEGWIEDWRAGRLREEVDGGIVDSLWELR